MSSRSFGKMPESLQRAIATQHPEIAAQAMGFPAMPPSEKSKAAAPTDEVKPKGKRGRSGGTKTMVGTIKCDSSTEAEITVSLAATYPAVAVHGCIALAPDTHIEPDFIIFEQVNCSDEPVMMEVPPGCAVARVADAKGTRVDKTTKSRRVKAHIEPDFKLKMKWLRDKTGLKLLPLTKQPSTSTNNKPSKG